MMGLCVIMSYGISIHALREEGDLKSNQRVPQSILFLSTPSVRRATFFGSAS